MKKRMIILFMALLSLSVTSKAQWAVFDPSNFAQSIVNSANEIIETSSTAENMINNFKETVKIYEQGKAYYDALKSVNNLIKDARKVKRTIEMIGDITNMYSTGFNKMASDPNFSVNELEAIALGYAKLLEEGGALVTELKTIITGGNGLSLSDKERMDVIDQIYTKMVDYRNLTQYYTNKNISISFIRSQQKGDMERVRALYGKPSDRYW